MLSVIFHHFLANHLITGSGIEISQSYGDIGYYVGRNDTRITFNIIYNIWSVIVLLLLTYYRFDGNEWFLNMSLIFDEIKTQSLNRSIDQILKKLLFFTKFATSCIIFNTILFLFYVLFSNYSNLFNLDKNCFLFIYISLEVVFNAGFGSIVICRAVAKYIFITKLSTLLFNDINKDFVEIMRNGNSHYFKNCFIKYYKICDLVNESNKFLKIVYIIYSSAIITFSSYALYHIIFSNADNIFKLIIGFLGINYITILFALSLITGNIDNEAKKSLHVIHGYASYPNDSNIIFQV